MKKAVEKILKNIEIHKKELEKNKKALAAMQDICEHQKEYIATTPAGDKVYDCVKCNKRFYE